MLFCCVNQHPNQPGNIRCDTCGSLLAGAQISDYRVASYIGKGSSSDVYLAEQNSLHGRKVAIKILHRSCSEEYVDSFRSEAKLLAALSHPYILPIFSYGVIHEATMLTANYVPYLVVQFAEQGSLAESFERQGNRPWSLERVVTLAKDAAEALDYAHSRNVLHRDIKPANILQIGSHALLSDFSVASLIDANASHLSTSLAGSPAYMAPEVWGMHPGRYSDQYALAITCFFLLTGKYPLTKNGSNTMRGWQHAHCFTTPVSLSEFRADLPQPVDVVLQKAMAKNPHERYPTVEAFALDLRKAAQEITQQLVKTSIPVLSPITRFRLVPDNIQANEKALVDLRPVDVSLANTPATEPIAIPNFTTSAKHSTRDHEGMNKTPVLEVHTSSPKTRSSRNRWIWCALTLNAFIIVMLNIEYKLLIEGPVFSFRLLLTLCPALLVGLLLALLFKRLDLTTLSWCLFWGILFGMFNALLSLLACMICNSLLLVVPFQGSTGGGLSSFFGPDLQFVSDPRVIVLLLLALWVSVTGGAIIGIFNMRGEDAARKIHPKQRKQNTRLQW
jgi:serine/threonine protein kinase